MSRKRRPATAHICRWHHQAPTYSHVTMLLHPIRLFVVLLAATLAVLVSLAARAQPAAASAGADGNADLGRAIDSVRSMARTAQERPGTAQADPQPSPRVEVITGELDARLRLAPCRTVQPYVPNGQRLWGRARVGLRCSSGPVHWNVYLPVTVRVWAPAVVAAADLPAGHELQASDLRIAEADIAAEPAPAWTSIAALLGRRLSRPMSTGAVLRQDDVQARVWFAAGDPVTVTARGPGYAVTSRAQALGPGRDGERVRVRTDNGRILVGQAVGQRHVEIGL